jgi:hypothetical protein
MENNSLHTQKVAILSRLIKESSLTLEEALLLLKEEEVVEEAPITVNPSWTPGTIMPWTTSPYTGNYPLVGTTTVTPGSVLLNTTNSGNTSTTSAFLNNPSTLTADLNN